VADYQGFPLHANGLSLTVTATDFRHGGATEGPRGAGIGTNWGGDGGEADAKDGRGSDLPGRRAGEVSAMRWAELDSPTAPTVWILPAERAKNARGHIVHLAEPMRAIIRELPRVRGSDFVFAGRGSQPIDASSHTKDQIQAALARTGLDVKDWRFHDFRRAGVTALAGMRFPPHVYDRILNHITGSIQGVAAVYQRHEFLDERAEALDAWSAFVLAAIGNLS
jgi:integrase